MAPWIEDRARELADEYGSAWAALHKLIAEHEQPPVDPFEVELESIADEVTDLWRASGGGQFVCKNFALAALKRGIELGKGANND